jgi:long-chain alkane monooxygenase
MKKMHLAFILAHGPNQHSIGTWALPGSFENNRFYEPEFWEDIAKTLERGKIDMLFFADTYGLPDTYKGRMDAHLRYAIQMPRHDPMPLVPLIARVTKHLGIGITASTTYLPPYHIARLFSTLDHLTRGRVAWNVVTSFGRHSAANFGMDEEMEKAERYLRADEYMDVCNALWGSWDKDALVHDSESMTFVDPAKVRKIHHKGKYFQVEGPTTVIPSPQGRPVILQAGASGDGVKFAGRHAEIQFGTATTPKAMREYRAKLVESAVAAGRRAEDVRILWATSYYVGETEAEALAKEEAAKAMVPLEGGLAMMSGHLGYDFSRFPLEEKIENLDLDKATGMQGVAQMLLKSFSGKTLQEVAMIYGNGIGGLRVVGSAKQVADQLEQIFDEGGGDGFMLRGGVLPTSVNDFVDLVVPELQRRGRFRKEYGGATLRDNLQED